MSGVYNDTFVNAADLSAEARGAADAVEAADALTVFMPSVETPELDYDLSAGVLGLPRAASFRSYDATAPFGREQSIGSKKGTLPASSIDFKLGELDRLRMRQASVDAFGQALINKAVSAGQSIAVRAVFARGEAISTGHVNLEGENGLVVDIDFGRDASLSVTAATVWSNPAALALTDIRSYQVAYSAINGGNAAGAITSSQVIANLGKNTEFIAAYYGRSTDSLPSSINRSQVLAVLEGEGISEVTIYDQQYVDTTGTKRRVIDQGKFLLVPSKSSGLGDSGALGQTQWGIPAEALNPTYGISDADQPGIFAAQFDFTNPESSSVIGSSIFLPVLSFYNETLDADVL